MPPVASASPRSKRRSPRSCGRRTGDAAPGRDQRARPHGRDECGRSARAARSSAIQPKPPLALAALTEIRIAAGRDAAIAALEGELEPEVQVAAVRYLAELGALEVLPMLRRLARSDDAEIRIAASLASRALKAERDRDAGERFLVALSEPDRAVRAVLARRLRTLPVKDVLEQAEVLLGEDAAGVVQILGEIRDSEITRYLLAARGARRSADRRARACDRRDRSRSGVGTRRARKGRAR